jgi:defect-in-organelle-trafficking protein DotB
MSLPIDRLNGFLLDREPVRFNPAEFDRLMIHAKKVGASDIYLQTDRPISARVHGRLVRLTCRKLNHAEVVDATCELYGGANADLQLRQGKPIDDAHSVKVDRDTSLRFRWCATGCLINANFGIEIVMRELAGLPPKLDRNELHPKLLAGLFPDDGLVLVTGETGAGKSTLLASIIREIAENAEADARILTFEAPIEYVYDQVETISCLIVQSAVPDDVLTFAEGIRNSLRRDPDAIVVGECRDAETIKAAIVAAQTGHALYTTVHSNNVATTFLRLIQALPVEELHSVMGSIIDSVRVIVSQQLVPSTDGKRVAVREFLVFDNKMRRELLSVATQNISLLPVRAAELVTQYGQTMDGHAEELHRAGRIDATELYAIRAARESDDARATLLKEKGLEAIDG